MNFISAVAKDLYETLRGPKYRKREGRPYMRYREMIIFEELLKNLQPSNILEWGAGYSTLKFPKLLKSEFSWLSIESDKEWAQRLNELKTEDKIKIEYIPANSHKRTDSNNDGSYDDFKDYIDYAEQFAPYDYIVIDGRARSACLKKAYQLIRDNGVVVIHDVNRKYYHEHFELFDQQFVITDNRKRSGGMALLSRQRDIASLVSTEKHLKNWKFVSNKVAHLFKL